MTAAAQKKATSTKATKAPAKKTALKVVDPAGNSGIPAPAPKGFDGRKIKLITKTIENRKIPLQAQVVLSTLEALGGSATQGELVNALLDPEVGMGLKTVQTPKRIYDFYRKDLMEEGYITYA